MNRLRPRDRFVQDRSILSCYPLAKSRWPESCPPTGNKNSLSLLADRDPKGETGLTSGASPQRKKAEGSDTLTVRRPLPVGSRSSWKGLLLRRSERKQKFTLCC